MSESIRESIYNAIASIRLVDPHTHINPLNPASQTLADILGYHYYTELVHSAGMPKSAIEQDGISPRELVSRLVDGLPNIENTANYQWLINICRTFFDFEDDRITSSNWESLYDIAEAKMASAEWPQMVLDKSNVEAVFLTNDFDDDLEGFDTNTYIPCLRTDDLVFHLGKEQTRERLVACSGIELDGSVQTLRDAIRQRFDYFVPRGARACAISIPPSFQPGMVSDGRAQTALDAVLRQGIDADISHQTALSKCVFWTLAELCDEYNVPFDLMIGVNRGVYPAGVYQGQDLYDSRVSLIQYKDLFNAFPDVKFPISVLASVTNQELVSYSWIFPNVITNGHWWYSNTPSFIARDAAARLEAVPKNKQIGYYSDAYKLEFVWPKFDMYRRILADILTDHFVGKNRWSEEQAIQLGYQVLRGNVDTIFPSRFDDESDRPDYESEFKQQLSSFVSQVNDIDEPVEEISEEFDEVEVVEEEDVPDEVPTSDSGYDAAGVVGAGAALAAGAIGMVEVNDSNELYHDQSEQVETGEQVEEFVDQYSAIEESAEESSTEELATESDVTTPDDDTAFQNQETWQLDDHVQAEPGESELAGFVSEESAHEDDVVADEDDLEATVDEAAFETLHEGVSVEEPVDANDQYEGVVEQEYVDEGVESDDEFDPEATVAEDDFQTAIDLHDTVVMEDSDGNVDVESEEMEVTQYQAAPEPAPEIPSFDPHEISGVYMQPMVEATTIDHVNEEVSQEVRELAETIDDVSDHLPSPPETVEAELDLDPSPSLDEIQSAGVADTEIRDTSIEGSMDAAAIDDVADPEPLDVGDLVAGEINEVADELEETVPEIQMLRGESGFVPDSESLQLEKDPHTGEFTFPNPNEGHETPETHESGSDEVISQLEAMIQETVELTDPDPKDD